MSSAGLSSLGAKCFLRKPLLLRFFVPYFLKSSARQEDFTLGFPLTRMNVCRMNLLNATLALILSASLSAWSFEATPDVSDSLKGFSSEDYSERQNAVEELTAASAKNLEHVVKEIDRIARTTKDPEIRFLANKTLRSIYKRRVLGIGEAYFGFELGWFIDHNGTDLSALPMVLEVAEGSPAEEAGFLPGDIINEMNGENCRDVNATNLLLNKLANSPIDVVVTMKVMNLGIGKVYVNYGGHKHHERQVAPIDRKKVDKDDSDKEFNVADYQSWLKKTTK